ncbi:MAG: hypothetical protein ACREOU_07245 [Candidatus Eiseniibacteriota bacterium]
MRLPDRSALPRSAALLCLAVAVALASASGPRSSRAQGLSAIDSIRYADSVALAETLRVQDSVRVADSLAFEAEAAETEASFGATGQRSILDRSRGPGAGIFGYNSTYSINRTNRNWSQGADINVESGRFQIGNVTTVNIGRETRVGRVSRNRQTRSEMAYRVSPWLRIGGGFGLQRLSDEAQTANFTPIEQANDDVSAQLRFNRKFGDYPVIGLASFGYLNNEQFTQQSEGTTFSFYGGTSRAFRGGSTVNLDVSQLISKLTSTVSDDPTYLQDDRNQNTDIKVSSNLRLKSWVSADARLGAMRSTVQRPARIFEDPTDPDAVTVVPERVNGRTDAADAALHFTLPQRTAINVSGSLSRNNQIYTAEPERSSVAQRRSIAADARRFIYGTDAGIVFENSITDNDYTRRDPGYFESSLQRRLEGNLNRPIGPRTTGRATAGIYLTQRRYEDFSSSLVGAAPPSDQDQLRIRGQLNVTYRPGTRFDTGLTLGLEQNELINIARTASINNATLRTYSVTWNWSARPGSIWSVSQNNTASAAQQYFTFSPERDQLSFIYNLSTLVTTQLSPKVRLDLNHLLRLQSRGSFRQDADVRRFGKASEFNTKDLSLRLQYGAAPWLTVEAQERLAVNPTFTVAEGLSTKTNETRRTEFTATARFNYAFSPRAGINGDVRRTLATDRTLTFGAAPTDRAVNNDYWVGTASMRVSF